MKAVGHLYIADSCCGCLACVDICPNNVLEAGSDDEGFPVPQIKSPDKCIDCGLCLRVCKTHNLFPSEDEKKNAHPQNTFIAIGQDSKDIRRSSSGGMFWTISKAFIQNMNGIVFGAGFDENLVVRHSYCDNISGLKSFQGSKYVQSSTVGVFKTIRELLNSGERVLFSGTPCQVNALKLFIPKKLRDNLFLIDIICHGVASPLLLSHYIGAVQDITKRKIKSIKFRWKNPLERGGSNFTMLVSMLSGRRVIGVKDTDAYLKSYLDGLCFRNCCYTCPFATTVRSGDITIGDCDSRHYYQDFHYEEASSSMIISTPKGDRLIKSVQTAIDLMPIDLNKEAKCNHQLNAPFTKPPQRQRFYQTIRELSSVDFFYMYGAKTSYFHYCKNMLLLYMPAWGKKFIANIKP